MLFTYFKLYSIIYYTDAHLRPIIYLKQHTNAWNINAFSLTFPFFVNPQLNKCRPHSTWQSEPIILPQVLRQSSHMGVARILASPMSCASMSPMVWATGAVLAPLATEETAPTVTISTRQVHLTWVLYRVETDSTTSTDRTKVTISRFGAGLVVRVTSQSNRKANSKLTV